MKRSQRFPNPRSYQPWELFLPSLAQAVLTRCAREEFRTKSREACGLLLGHSQLAAPDPARAEVQLITRCANVAGQSSRNRVELDPGHLVRAQHMAHARNLEVLGTWHAHSDEAGARALSVSDLGMGWEGALLLVVVAKVGEPRLAAWRYSNQ